jgi:GT2 family glycosyltransferase/glycosyltransferase involved in cell wall biosynthesis
MEDKASRRIRLLPLQAAVACGDFLANRIGPNSIATVKQVPVPQKGISIIIPERGNPELLLACVESAEASVRSLTEPAEIIVVVNGSPPDDYRRIMEQHRSLQWLFQDQPLGFASAVRKGLKLSRYDWVYLLNSDVILEREALVEVARWRGPAVFAVSSQIFMAETVGRRVETGWTDHRIVNGILEILDVRPEESDLVRGNLYAGGGASLFQRDLLLRFLGKRDPYYPFYWEDVEWGVRARKAGFVILFCPASRVHHVRRATIGKYYGENEAERIFRRNGWLFQLRNIRTLVSFEHLWLNLIEIDDDTFRELTCWRKVLSVFLARIGLARDFLSEQTLEYAGSSFHLKSRLALAERPLVLIASPFALFPPVHGGAVRVHRLLKEMSCHFDLVLLSDEAGAYASKSIPYFRDFAEVYLIGNRTETAGSDTISRIESHSRPMMKEILASLIRSLKPDLVQIEFSELAGLVSVRQGNTPWLITLHEVQPSDGSSNRREQSLLAQFDGIIVCSPEDQAMVSPANAMLVPNGVDIGISYSSSAGNRSILFAGPFRYRPNFEGIRSFLEEVYPCLIARFHDITLNILGGAGAADMAAGMRCFRQQGVIIYDYAQDPGPFLERAALSINPLTGIGGSSIKLLESIAAGRVVVATREAARGFADAAFRSMILVESVRDFFDPIAGLLTDENYRIGLERPEPEVLENYSWKNAGNALSDIWCRFAGAS